MHELGLIACLAKEPVKEGQSDNRLLKWGSAESLKLGSPSLNCFLTSKIVIKAQIISLSLPKMAVCL